MADLISRLKLESGEFDSRIQRATKGLLTMERECREVGGTLAILEKDQLEFVRGLGQMETVSQNARGKLSEMTSAFTELSLLYKRLTDEEKQGDFGTALAASLEELKGRISEARADLEEVGRTVAQIGGSFEQLADEIGIPAEELQGFIDKAADGRQKLNEYNKSLDALTQAYQNLSEEEKKGDKGQKMAAAMDKLKDKIKETKKELKGIEKEMGDSGLGGVLDKIASKLGIPMELFTKFGPIIAAVGVAAKVAKDTFNANESAVDEWGRTVESAKSIYEGFVTSLNTGDFSGFLNRMGKISAAARKAYDELDRLGTMKTIQSPEMSRQQTENERNRMMIQTRRYIAPLDGSAGIPGMKNGQLLTSAQVKQIETDLQNGIQRVVTLVTNEIDQTSKAIEAEYERQAKVIGLSLDEFKKGTSSMAEFDRVIELAKKYYEFENAHTTTYSNIDNMGMVTTTRVRDNEVNPYEGAQKWDVFRVDGEAYNKLVQLIQQREQQTSQAYSMQSQAYRAINRAEGISVRGGTKVNVEPIIPEGSAAALKKQIADLQKQWDLATSDSDRSGIQKQIDEAQKDLDAMTGKLKDIPSVEIPLTFSEQGISDLEKQIKDKLNGLEIGSGDYLIAASNLVDFNTFQNLLRSALNDGLQIDTAWFSSLIEDIKVGVDVDPSSWSALVESINQQRAALNLPPIVLDIDTGAVTELKKELGELPSEFDEVRESLDKFSSGVGAVSDLVGAMENLKSIGEDLADVFSGEMDAWDSLMTVLNSGISVLETIISVTEAINTLKSLGIGLSEKKATTEGVEAAATVAAASIEASAEGEKAAASLGAAGANAAESSSAAGKAVSWIPIVGPILAVAAIAAVLGSTIAAISKSKSAGHYAQGGIVPGSDYTDNTPVFVSSGELILNKAQQNNVASAIQERNPLGNLKLVSRLSGKDILIAIDNTNRSEGGSRGYYTRIH